MANPFFDALQLAPTGTRSFEGQLGAEWNLRPLPQGGVVTAMAVRAMELELARPEQRPRTLHTTFAAQVEHGKVTIEVEPIRLGRSMSQLRAQVRNPDAERGHLTTCVFGSTRRGFSFTDLRPPESIPAPEECPSFRDPAPDDWVMEPMPFWASLVEGRTVQGHPPWEDYVPDRAERAMWYRFDEPPFLEDGQIDPLSLIVLADTMPGAVGERVGRVDRQWFAPSVDLTVHFLDECRSPYVLAHNTARFAGDGYASADMALWDCGIDGRGEPRLVVYATQLFLFTFR
jgi:Thioesterase-like superfamily